MDTKTSISEPAIYNAKSLLFPDLNRNKQSCETNILRLPTLWKAKTCQVGTG